MENEEVQGALEIVGPTEESAPAAPQWSDAQIKAIVEAAVYVTDEPLSADQIATALQQPAATVARVLEELTEEYAKPEHGLQLREVAGGYKISTKPEHHEAIRSFVKNLKPPMKLSLPALETLALIAYKQPVTVPEIAEIRNVAGAGVVKTLLDRKLIAVAGRKKVLGNPMLYKTTKEFLVQFGLKDLSELPTLKEFEDLARLSMGESSEGEEPSPESANAEQTSAEPQPPAAPETAE
ncbi:MAG TPA: SMC-Scp complex subunit ScpB [Bryobacteraceae bacterium]|nr:SMC-Scp complex subunit ScpB [Bryobacteraceae bacterium]